MRSGWADRHNILEVIGVHNSLLGSLLVDEMELRRFYETVVPDLQANECIIMMLAARKKYYSGLARSEECLRREVLRYKDWNNFLRKVKRLTMVKDLYVDEDGKEIPMDAFAAYIVLDTKNAVKAWIMLQKEMSDKLYQLALGDETVLDAFRKVDVRWFSCLHRSKGRKLYWLIDIDAKSKDVLCGVVDAVEKHNVVWVSETRGGYHVIVKANDMSARSIFREKRIERIEEEYGVAIEVHKEPMTPLPGCLQGGFVVRGIKFEVMSGGGS